MNVTDVLTITRKDLRVALSHRTTKASLVALPLIAAIAFNLVLRRAGGQQGIPAAVLPRLLESFLFFFVIASSVLPTSIASYSLVGEKVERSLEPLLATPITEFDLMLGKALAAFIPSVFASWVGAGLYIALANQHTSSTLGVTYLPNATAWVILLPVIPLAALLSVLLSVLISVRATDVRSAQQASALIAIPFAGIYVSSEIGLFTLDPTGMWWLALALAVADVAFFFVARAAFGREEILTRLR